MSCQGNASDINQTFLIEPLSITGGSPTLTACTALYTNAVVSCSGDTQIFMGTGIITFNGILYTNDDLSASTINASTYYSGGTNLFNIIDANNITGGTYDTNNDVLNLYKTNGNTISVTGFTDYYTTGATLIGTTVYFDRNDTLSAYTLNLSPFTADTYVTGVTFNDNKLIVTRNDGVSLNTFINTFTGLTINGQLNSNSISATTAWFINLSANTVSATTFYGDGSHLTGLPYVTGGTFNNNTDTITFTNSTGGTFTVTGLTDYYTTGSTLIGNVVYFDRNDVLSAYTLDLSGLGFVTGGTFNNNNLILTNNTGGTISVLINNLSGLTINGNLNTTGSTFSNYFSGGTGTFTTIYGNGVNITGLPYVTGGTFNANTRVITFTNSTGGTFTVTGLTDYYITGGTFNQNNNTLRYTRNDNTNIDVILPVRSVVTSSANTNTNSFITIDSVTGITDNTNSILVSYITAFKDNIDYGFWKRTLAINKFSGLVSIIGENVDFDRVSSGLTSTSVVYLSNGGNLDIKVSGETSKNYYWSSNWEIIK